MGLHSFITTGNIMNKEFCFDKLVNELDPFDFDAFKNNDIEFYAVASELQSGKPAYFRIKDIRNEKESEMLRASGSLPLVSKNVKIDGKDYLDGGIADSIPIREVLKKDYDKVIVVCTRPEGYRKKKSNTLLFKLKYKKYPKFVKTMENRADNYNKSLDIIKEEEKKKHIFVFRPSEYIKVGRVEKDVQVINKMYFLGMSDAENRMKELKKYLGVK
jgi:predicted patatin/cPLA2 family phospholipase